MVAKSVAAAEETNTIIDRFRGERHDLGHLSGSGLRHVFGFGSAGELCSVPASGRLLRRSRRDPANHTVELTVNLGSNQTPRHNSIIVSGTTLVLRGTGASQGSYHVLTTTNAALPMTNWSIMATGSFDGVGNFNVTNAMNPANRYRFFLIEAP